jgi:hypothetical protein
LDVPHSLKFWKLSIFKHDGSSGLIAANLDFRKKKVLVEGTKVDTSCSGLAQGSLKETEALSAEALQTSKESFTKSTQTVLDQEGFDGFTLGDMHLLLRNLKVSDTEPSGSFSLLFEEVDASENETPDKFIRYDD